MFEIVLSLGLFVGLVLLGLVVGRGRERRHLADLDRREARTAGVLVTDLRSFAGPVAPGRGPTLLTTEVVIASDAFKNIAASLRNIVGGRLVSFETLLLRARREARLRLVEEALRLGCDALANLRMETADIGGSAARGGQGMPMAVVLAAATAYRRAAAPDAVPPGT